MEDGWWTLPLFMSCGCSGVPGRGCAGPHAAAAASGPGCAEHGQGPLGPAGPSPAPRVGCIARLMRTFRPQGRGGPASSVGPLQAYMSKFAGATWSLGPPAPDVFKRTVAERVSEPGISDR